MKKILVFLFILYFLGVPKIALANTEVVFENIGIVTQNLEQCSILRQSVVEYENSVTILGNGWNKDEEIINNLEEQLKVCESKTTVTENLCTAEKEALVTQKKINEQEVNLLKTQLDQCKPTFIEKLKNALGWFSGGVGTTLALILLHII